MVVPIVIASIFPTQVFMYNINLFYVAYYLLSTLKFARMNTNNNQRPSHDDDIELLPVSLGTSVDSTDDDVVVADGERCCCCCCCCCCCLR